MHFQLSVAAPLVSPSHSSPLVQPNLYRASQRTCYIHWKLQLQPSFGGSKAFVTHFWPILPDADCPTASQRCLVLLPALYRGGVAWASVLILWALLSPLVGWKDYPVQVLAGPDIPPRPLPQAYPRLHHISSTRLPGYQQYSSYSRKEMSDVYTHSVE